MNQRNWISASADFGGRGAAYGLGAVGEDSFFAPGQEAIANADAAYAAADEARQQVADMSAKVAALTSQLEAAQASGTATAANIAYSLQAQIGVLKDQISSQSALANSNSSAGLSYALQPYKKYLPYAAVGAALLVVLLVARK